MWLEFGAEVALARVGGGCGNEGEDGLKIDENDEGVRKQAGENGENGDNDRGRSTPVYYRSTRLSPLPEVWKSFSDE
jgi:hypothetical protein